MQAQPPGHPCSREDLVVLPCRKAQGLLGHSLFMGSDDGFVVIRWFLATCQPALCCCTWCRPSAPHLQTDLWPRIRLIPSAMSAVAHNLPVQGPREGAGGRSVCDGGAHHHNTHLLGFFHSRKAQPSLQHPDHKNLQSISFVSTPRSCRESCVFNKHTHS